MVVEDGFARRQVGLDANVFHMRQMLDKRVYLTILAEAIFRKLVRMRVSYTRDPLFF